MIHVCYGLYDKDGRYSKFTATSMLSLFENVTTSPPPSVIVHILHDNTLTLENRDKFNQIAGRYNQQIKFYNVEMLFPDKIIELKNAMPSIVNAKYTIATLYRLLIPYIMTQDIEKLIYLDSDTVINLDIQELWQVDMKDKVLAIVSEFENGVPEDIHNSCKEGILDGKKYFNAGVLLINLIQLRNLEGDLRRSIKFIEDNPTYDCFDQDILNHCFLDKSIFLPKRFNTLVEFARRLKDFDTNRRICHYITSERGVGFGMDMSDPYNRIFLKYFSKTPYFNEETIGKLYEGIRQLYVQQKQFSRQVSAIVSGKTRAFFVQPNILDAVKQIFSINPEEEIVLADSPASLQVLVNSMKNSDGKKIFFIVIINFSVVYNVLTRAGFSYGKDFLNAFEFLSDAEGIPLNPYPFLKLL